MWIRSRFIALYLCFSCLIDILATKNEDDEDRLRYNHDDYTGGKTYRRQLVIHALNDDKATTDDDIEMYGKAIDSTGAVIKSKIHSPSKTSKQTKDIIAKIKEIQDRIFKRTGSKELEAKLKEMSPQGMPEPVNPMKKVDVTGDKRKIIPEDVVDKILQKFQQLRSEAKNIALSGETKKNRPSSKPIIESNESAPEKIPNSPYASIGPPRESLEIKNRTEHADDIAPMGIDGKGPPEAVQNTIDGNIQIPIGSSVTESNQLKSGKTGIPLMFVKNGQNLIPVFSNGLQQPQQQQQTSIVGQSSVQYNENSGVAAQSLPYNVVPLDLGQQIASFMSGNLQAGKEIQPPVVDASELTNNPSSRCAIPGPDCAQQVNIPNIDSGSETMELLNKLLHSPGFPKLASRLLGGSSDFNPFNSPTVGQRLPERFYNPNFDQTAESRALNPTTNGDIPISMPADSKDIEGMNPASIQFNLKENLADKVPGSPSMLQHENVEQQADHNTEVQNFLNSLPHYNPTAPVDPFSSSYPNSQASPDYHFGSLKERTINDISDPLENEMATRFRERSPDELLEFAKYRSLVTTDINSPLVHDVANNPYGRNERDDGQGPYEHMDPSNLLDTLHSSQLKNNLAGAGDPSNYGDLSKYHKSMLPGDEIDDQGWSKHNIPEPAPDDLLDKLRHFNQDMQSMQHMGKRLHLATYHQHIPLKFGSMDPSFADEIRTENGGVQRFDVERKDIATEHNTNKDLLGHYTPKHRHGDISVLSDDMLQYKHGRLSMDSDNILSTFPNERSYSRNQIGRPHHQRHHYHRVIRTYTPVTRGVIEHPSTEDDVELRVNGKLLTDNVSLRSTIVDGKIHPGKGKTFASKDPVQIELSHGDDKRKIINIISKGRYNVTQDYKRMKIPKFSLNT